MGWLNRTSTSNSTMDECSTRQWPHAGMAYPKAGTCLRHYYKVRVSRMVAPMAGILRYGWKTWAQKTVEKDYMIYRRKVQFGYILLDAAKKNSSWIFMGFLQKHGVGTYFCIKQLSFRYRASALSYNSNIQQRCSLMLAQVVCHLFRQWIKILYYCSRSANWFHSDFDI